MPKQGKKRSREKAAPSRKKRSAPPKAGRGAAKKPAKSAALQKQKKLKKPSVLRGQRGRAPKRPTPPHGARPLWPQKAFEFPKKRKKAKRGPKVSPARGLPPVPAKNRRTWVKGEPLPTRPQHIPVRAELAQALQTARPLPPRDARGRFVKVPPEAKRLGGRAQILEPSPYAPVEDWIVYAKELQALHDPSGWVDPFPPEMHRIDGSIAVRPSRLRLHENWQDFYARLHKDPYESDAWRKQARDIQRELNLSIHEIYTLYFSP